MQDILNHVRTFVEDECRKPTSKYGFEPFQNHFVPTVRYAEQLASELGADMEIVQIAAWFHDIGSISFGRKDHHITGAKIASELLTEWGYPEDRIKWVQGCILNHRGSVGNAFENTEEQVVAEADAMSAFDNLSGLFKAAFVYEHLSQDEAAASIKQKLERKWGQLSESSKNIVRARYEAAILLLS